MSTLEANVSNEISGAIPRVEKYSDEELVTFQRKVQDTLSLHQEPVFDAWMFLALIDEVMRWRRFMDEWPNSDEYYRRKQQEKPDGVA